MSHRLPSLILQTLMTSILLGCFLGVIITATAQVFIHHQHTPTNDR